MESAIFNLYVDILTDMIQRDMREEIRREGGKTVGSQMDFTKTINWSIHNSRELETEDSLSYRNMLRMIADQFEGLLALVQDKGQKQDAVYVPPVQRITSGHIFLVDSK